MSSKTFDIADLSNNLTDLLSDIQNQVEVTLTRQGVPWAKVLPLDKQGQAQPLFPKAGLNRGSMVMSDDFDDPLPDAFWGL
jgi:antitoxin (DNA-binding transcriptional repressor) of toxin-antitoxin stability system